ncbi:MAG: hypothetical protein GY823_02000 [Flavobacteriaceae bacterium]|nr:hypothetical protein [Flavobacteriaceae bacterium]
MKKRLAIINCKSKKKQYKCVAEEMYSVSFQFRAQIEFIKKYYDDYAILSTKYGIIYPTSIIEPYEMSLAQGARLKMTNPLSERELDEWVNSVNSQLKLLSEVYDEIDLHISNQYLKPIKKALDNPKISHIKQPVNPGLVKNRYNEVLEILNNGGEVDLNSIGEIRKSKNPEISREWYHNEFETFIGFARHLCKEYPEVDEGNASMVSKGKNLHTRGWVIEKSLLSKLYKTESGQWRVKKS